MANPDIKVIKLKVRRGTDAQRKQVTLDQGEIGYTTDTKRLFVGDGLTVGGTPVDNKHFVRVSKFTSLSNTAAQVNDIVMVGNPAVAYMLRGQDYTNISNWMTFTNKPDNKYLQFSADQERSGTLTLRQSSIDMSILNMSSLASETITFENNRLVVDYNPDELRVNTNGLGIADNAISARAISQSIIGTGLSGGGGSPIGVKLDFDTLSFNPNGELTVINTPLTAVQQSQLSSGFLIDPVSNNIVTALQGVDASTMTLVNGIVGVKNVSYDLWDETATTVQGNSATWGGDFCDSVVYMNSLSSCGSGAISISADLDLNGGSLINVGNNSIIFESGARVSGQDGNITLTPGTSKTVTILGNVSAASFTDESSSNSANWNTGNIYTVNTLPITGASPLPSIGHRAFVSDSLNPLSSQVGLPVLSGATNFVPVFYNGTDWIVG
jgi:hypothetical protein